MEVLRILIVQSTPRLTSEVGVLQTLLAHLPASDRAAPLEALLIQGADGAAPADVDDDAVSAFGQLQGVSVHAISMGRLGRSGLSLRSRARKVSDLIRVKLAMPELFGLARQFQPDLVYSSQQIWDLRLATPLARHLDRPQFIHLHYTCGPWLGRAAMEALRQAESVICVSDFIRRDASRNGVPPDRLFTLRNAIKPMAMRVPEEHAMARNEIRVELSIPVDAVAVGMTARLAPFKGQEQLLTAMLPLLQQNRRVHLILAGAEYPGRNGMTVRMAARANADGVRAQVHLLGHRTDVPRILDGLDIFAHPSLAEPCSIAVLEAMARGLPVVAWREGGTTELVSDNQTGLLVDTFDLPGLAAALGRLVDDSGCRTMMGCAALDRIRSDFSPPYASARWMAMLKEGSRRWGPPERGRRRLSILGAGGTGWHGQPLWR